MIVTTQYHNRKLAIGRLQLITLVGKDLVRDVL